MEKIHEKQTQSHMGSVINKDRGADEDIKCRINKARCAFNSLRPMWRCMALSLESKIGIFNTNVKAVLLYGTEAWRVTKTNTDRLQSFINKCLQHILKIRWPDKISNKDLWHILKQQPMDWNPQGKRKVGRPKKTW